MAIVFGIDLGTTTITALAADLPSGKVLASHTVPTPPSFDAQTGRAESDARAIARAARSALRHVAGATMAGRADWAGIGITGQQHGIVVVDEGLRPLTPFIGWRDRRAEGALLEKAQRLAGDTAARTGCRLANGYGAVTLFALKQEGRLPVGTACTLMDYFAASLTGERPVSEPTCAASVGAFDIVKGEWDCPILDALDVPRGMFPAVKQAGTRLGGITAEAAEDAWLPQGLPVYVGIGDNQASFLGSVGEPTSTVLVNVGTGGQVSAFSPVFRLAETIEARPFPGGGYLLVSAGLCGGAALASLGQFFHEAAYDVGAMLDNEGLLDKLVALADEAPPGCDGLVCEPYFHGSRHDPDKRASFTGITSANFKAGHMARAVMEGMARAFAGSYDRLKGLRGSASSLAGAGNGLRANPLLARLVGEAFGMPLRLSPHPEEAAFGAALSTRLQG